mmetsp:Transcript_38984/g.87797  ORF Transcript_38984/g.87797 Transcript_38984/m.87797 type:complete len:101 (+) Transcript_38984:58-360(+)
MMRVLLILVLSTLLAAPMVTADGSYERVDPDMDIMALIDGEDGFGDFGDFGEPSCGAGGCAAGKGDAAPASGEGISVLQVDAKYKLMQPVKHEGIKRDMA